MDLLWKAIPKPENDRSAYEKYAYGTISENYRRVYEVSSRELYDSQHLLCDTISGMTEQYLIKMHEELKGLYRGPS